MPKTFVATAVALSSCTHMRCRLLRGVGRGLALSWGWEFGGVLRVQLPVHVAVVSTSNLPWVWGILGASTSSYRGLAQD